MTANQLLPNLTSEEYADLKADIEKRGVQVPVVLNHFGQIIDGHHRVQICEELGITDYPRSVRTGLTPDDETELALVLNTHRRQLDREQRRELVAKLRSDGWSTRRIADATGVSQPTVRSDLSSGEKFLSPETITGADGKQYPASRPVSNGIPSLPTDPEFAPERPPMPGPNESPPYPKEPRSSWPMHTSVPTPDEREFMERTQAEQDQQTEIRVVTDQLSSCLRIASQGLNHKNSRANYRDLFDPAQAGIAVDRDVILRAAENLRLLGEEWNGD